MGLLDSAAIEVAPGLRKSARPVASACAGTGQARESCSTARTDRGGGSAAGQILEGERRKVVEGDSLAPARPAWRIQPLTAPRALLHLRGRAPSRGTRGLASGVRAGGAGARGGGLHAQTHRPHHAPTRGSCAHVAPISPPARPPRRAETQRRAQRRGAVQGARRVARRGAGVQSGRLASAHLQSGHAGEHQAPPGGGERNGAQLECARSHCCGDGRWRRSETDPASGRSWQRAAAPRRARCARPRVRT